MTMTAKPPSGAGFKRKPVAYKSLSGHLTDDDVQQLGPQLYKMYKELGDQFNSANVLNIVRTQRGTLFYKRVFALGEKDAAYRHYQAVTCAIMRDVGVDWGTGRFMPFTFYLPTLYKNSKYNEVGKRANAGRTTARISDGAAEAPPDIARDPAKRAVSIERFMSVARTKVENAQGLVELSPDRAQLGALEAGLAMMRTGIQMVLDALK